MCKRILRSSLLVLIICVLTITGVACQKPMTTEDRKERMKELLKDKYGEEFEIRELYNTGKVEAWCYPVSNPTMVFKADTTIEMEEISQDDYLQSLVGRQIDVELQPYASRAFGECIVFSHILLGSTNGFPSPNANTISLDRLIEYEHKNNYGDSIHIYIFVNINKSKNKIKEEFSFVNEIGEMIRNEKLPSSTKLFIFFGDDIFLIDVQASLDEFGWRSFGSSSRRDIMDVIEDKNEMGIYYNDIGNPTYRNSNLDELSEIDLIKYTQLRSEVIK